MARTALLSWLALSLVFLLSSGYSPTSILGQESPDTKRVVVATVTEQVVNTGYRVVGTVTPLRTSTVGSATDGRVEEYLVELGQAVVARQPLARLRTRTLEIELAAAQAELDLYHQMLLEKENGARAEEIAEAEARAQGAKAALDNAMAQLRRLEALSTSLAASEEDLENARERVNLARSAHSASLAVRDRIKSGPRIEQIEQARAQYELQQQRVALIEDRIEKHTIVAPFDGFVSAEFTEVGAWISAGDPVAEVIQLDEVEINAPVTADHAVKLRRGSTIRVGFPELPAELLTGTIDRIVPVAESRARTFPVIIRLQNKISDGSPLLLSGMLARVDLPAGREAKLPLVPKDALVLSDRQRSVFVVEPDEQPNSDGTMTGIVREVTVDLGVALGNRIQVDGELAAGQIVVVVGNERLVPGEPVSIVEWQEDTPPSG